MINEKYLLVKIDKNSELPAANQLAKKLTWLIADGVIKKEEQLPPIRDYGKLLDIHHHTVRAAYHLLEERKLVSIRPRIGTIVQEYVPFLSGSPKDNLDQNIIAILVPSLSDYYQQIISGIDSIALETGLIPAVLSCHEDPKFAEVIYHKLAARGITGIINISLGFSDDFYANFKLKENLNVPLIFLDVTDANTHSITINMAEAINLAANHLLDHGYDDLALINCPSNWPVGREALLGFRRTLESRRKTFTQASVFTVPDFGYKAGQFIIERMLQADELPRGIVAVSDNIAIGALSSIKANGLRVPEDVAIIGLDNILPASYVDPPLTTIGLPLFEMGKQTMLSLNKILSGNMTRWLNRSFSGQLVIRKSCGC